MSLPAQGNHKALLILLPALSPKPSNTFTSSGSSNTVTNVFRFFHSCLSWVHRVDTVILDRRKFILCYVSFIDICCSFDYRKLVLFDKLHTVQQNLLSDQTVPADILPKIHDLCRMEAQDKVHLPAVPQKSHYMLSQTYRFWKILTS